MPTVQHFITEDEIDAAMTGGSGFAGGKGRIYAFFMENHTDKEKVRSSKTSMALADALMPCPAQHTAAGAAPPYN